MMNCDFCSIHKAEYEIIIHVLQEPTPGSGKHGDTGTSRYASKYAMVRACSQCIPFQKLKFIETTETKQVTTVRRLPEKKKEK
jgi:hypothetical protein